jgi:hypothetical protein
MNTWNVKWQTDHRYYPIVGMLAWKNPEVKTSTKTTLKDVSEDIINMKSYMLIIMKLFEGTRGR